YDTDQRPLRKVLEQYDGPMLIVHGRNDVLVPIAAAREHHRLVPQSEFQVLERNHFFVFTRGGDLSGRLEGFFERVEAGEALTRNQADPERAAQAALPFDPNSVPPFKGLSLVLVMLALAAATLVSEDLTCIGAGLLVSAGRLSLLSASIACIAGIYLGDLMLYLSGRWLGQRALGHRPFSWLLSKEDVERSSRWFDRKGAVIILLSRFLPGTRLPTYFAAGLFRTRFWRFSLFFLLAAVLWTPLLVGLAAWLGAGAREVVAELGRWAWLGLVAVAAAVLLTTRILLPALSHRGRRLLRGKLRRLVRWEYWPPWVFYPPVVAWILWLGVRHRSPTLFTAANPAIPASGFIGESKSRIL
ncbi:MAG: VTT domain-containing protein, partial [Acidobacteria bacterium]|nr:VTT domain-containing protein [Acidobacteriota bacterium]